MLRTDQGELLPFNPARWHDEPTVAEQRLLESLVAPVLDVGCGPGRLVVGLGRLGLPALGVDPAAGAVALALRRGAPALQRSVFGRVPGEGRWRTVLLLDGNVGIGGNPVRLLRRCRELAAASGRIVAELDAHAPGWRTHRVRLEQGTLHSAWFGWASVGVDAIGSVAATAGLTVQQLWEERDDGRWFAYLEPA